MSQQLRANRKRKITYVSKKILWFEIHATIYIILIIKYLLTRWNNISYIFLMQKRWIDYESELSDSSIETQGASASPGTSTGVGSKALRRNILPNATPSYSTEGSIYPNSTPGSPLIPPPDRSLTVGPCIPSRTVGGRSSRSSRSSGQSTVFPKSTPRTSNASTIDDNDPVNQIIFILQWKHY